MATHTDITNQTTDGKSAYIDVLIDQDVDDDLTGAADLQNYSLVGVIMPATWTAADITFEGSVDDTTFNTIKSNSGTTYTLTVAASEYIYIPISDSFLFPRYIKVATSAGQAADRTVTLVLKK